ncbi:unnamed protein product, partial [Medioppia subpectinata]
MPHSTSYWPKTGDYVEWCPERVKPLDPFIPFIHKMSELVIRRYLSLFWLQFISLKNLDTLSKYCSDNEYAKNSYELIRKAFDDYKADEICVAFNGGKDCTALLHIVYSVFIAKYPNNKLNVFYIAIPESFPSLENFVQQSVRRYALNLITYSEPDFKKSMQKLKNETKISAIFMGTRSGDLPKH